MNITPIGNQIFVEEFKEETKVNGIYLPDSAQKLSGRGTVVAAGRGKTLNNGQKYQMSVKVGDIVFFDPLDCREVTVNGKDYVVLMDEEIYATSN